MDVARRCSMARARVAVARKLGVILHRMRRDEADFRFGKAPTAVAARGTTRRRPEKPDTRLRSRGRDRSHGDDGRGDPVECPGRSDAVRRRRETDWDATLSSPHHAAAPRRPRREPSDPWVR
jgi:hypothetical protein